MLSIDSRSTYGRLQFPTQDEIQILKVIYAAACDMSNTNMWKLRDRIKATDQDAVRVLSYIHTSDLDSRPHITLLYTLNPQEIVHIIAKLDDSTQRWAYVKIDTAVETHLTRNLKSPKHYNWQQLETYGTLGQ